MRARKTRNGITMKLYAGTTAVLMAFNVTDERRKGLLGFAVRRKDHHRSNPHPGRWRWIRAALTFPHDGKNITYKPVKTNVGPIQKFRWSDYAVYPNHDYEYQVIGVYGTPKNKQYVYGPKIKIKTENPYTGIHQVVFNRAAAASQAYERKPFGHTNPDDESDPLHQAARDWLTRGLRQKIERFIRRAKDENYALEVAIYEIEYDGIVDLLRKAIRKGVHVHIVYHAKRDDEQTHVNEQFLRRIPKRAKTGRVTSAIFHQKFIVLSKKNRHGEMEPRYVLTGTANFTPNGLWRQANVVHVIRDKTIAAQYHQLFTHLKHATDRYSDTKKYIQAHFPVADADGRFPVFTPRYGFADIALIKQYIESARSELFLCSTFKIHDDITEAIRKQTKVIRYGLQNKRSSITGIHRSRSFTVPAILNKGLEGFLKESTKGQRGNILIHLKTLLVDFASDQPIVIVGSHNFSRPASSKNDENFIVIKGDTSVADIYFGEMMRLYDHYRFRYNIRERQKRRKPHSRRRIVPIFLKPNDSWTDPYFKSGTLKCEERIRLSRK